MLDDADRNNQYEAAIATAIADFRRAEGRPPVVVDLGCGTGMLTLFALRHGAAHVFSIDINLDVAGMCEHVVETAREPGWGTQETVCETFEARERRPAWLPASGYDLLISEILGTTGFSESMHEHIGLALAHINTFADDRVYCVPQKLEVTATWYTARALGASESSGTNLPLLTALSGLQYWDGDGPITVDFLHTKDGLFLHHMECAPVAAAMLLQSGDYRTREPTTTTKPKRQRTTLPVSPTTVLVIEWTATLWGDVVLRNTLRELERMPPRNAATRACQWGHLYFRPFAEEREDRLVCTMGVSRWAKGVPKLRLTAAPT